MISNLSSAFFRTFIARLEGLASYVPSGLTISVGALEELWTKLDGLESAFDGVKLSVKGQYGHRSAQYQAVSGIRWRG